MATNPIGNIDETGLSVDLLEKSQRRGELHTRTVVMGHLQFARDSTGSFPADARILDFGCGIGESVQTLLDLGYDAYGVDVLEVWNKEFEKYWQVTEIPPEALRQRLFKVSVDDYRLPFKDGTFDFCFSDQVFEHVFNYEAVFAEIARVLKPGAISAHRFPGPGTLKEGHIDIPIIPLCRYRWYLTTWAIAGKRSVRQKSLTWRETVESNVEMLRSCNYPTKAELFDFADKVGVRIEFRDGDGIRLSGIGRAHHIHRIASQIRLGPLALWALSAISQRYMLIHGACR